MLSFMDCVEFCPFVNYDRTVDLIAQMPFAKIVLLYSPPK